MIRMVVQLIPLLPIIMFLAACGKDGAPGLDGSTNASEPVEKVMVDDVQEDINYLVDDENSYREGLAQAPLTSGLSCSVYRITGGHRIQPTGTSGVPTLTGITLAYTFLYKGFEQQSFNQPNGPSNVGVNVLPGVLRPQFTNLYMLRCTGYIVVLESDYYSFETSSDDASLLYVAGALTVDNDGAHGVTTKSGSKYLRRGIHAFRLDYAQSGAGSQALMLKVNGEFINPKFYVH